ncbi:MAG TPA: SPFH domain-containing protein [Oscillospiraceae bacterium]|nr:SPFH domain-containing protein [Oscillospiraceae bacterium]
MGLIKAAVGAIGGALGDQWLETIEPAQMDNSTISTYGVAVRKGDSRSSNKKGTEDVLSNGSVIHVPENTFMLLVDGGKIISATDEPGYYQVDNSRAPSIFFKAAEGTDVAGYANTGKNAIQRPGGIINTLKDSWDRFKFGGTTPVKQTVVYINKQEIPNIRFGTKNPVPYTDRVLVPGRVVPCKITSFGTYSIKVADPLLFYAEVCNKGSKNNLMLSDLAEQYINEFLMAYTTALASLSADSVLVSDIPIKTMELGQYMAEVLDNEWLSKRGFLIHSVGIASISFDEKTDKLLEQYGSDSILFDPNARAARMTAGMAAGLEAAGSNEGGAMMGFAGMAMGMNAASGMGVMPNQQQAYPQQGQVPPPPTVNVAAATTQPTTSGWDCSSCGKNMPNEAVFCAECGNKKPEPASSDKWECSCGNITEDNFCSKCGNKRAEQASYKCSNCSWEPADPKAPPKFCPKCGDPFNESDKV